MKWHCFSLVTQLAPFTALSLSVMTLGGVPATTQQTQERQTAVCGCAISHQCAEEWTSELCFTRRISLSVIDFYINFCPTLLSWKLCEPWRSVYGFQWQITKECGRSLVVKIHVMNVENNSVNEIFQTGFCSVDTWHFALYFHNHSFCRILLVWGMHSFEQNSSALHPTPVLCIQVDPFIWALWSRLRVKTLEAGKPLSKPGNIPSRLYRWHIVMKFWQGMS